MLCCTYVRNGVYAAGMMVKLTHEVRDPVHQFVRFDEQERRVIDSRPVQRLRHIHQLGTTYLVYPGATHRRFEHSLGVMELAGRVFDVITHPENVHPTIRGAIREITDTKRLSYWRELLRMAALCHDLGHIPFSHAAERELLPEGWSHEKLSATLIRSDLMSDVWQSAVPAMDAGRIAKIAVGKRELRDEEFSDWEAILSEIVVSDAFGVDRMDYLLRDSLHCGVAYGRFDHYRLIDTLRVLPQSTDSEEPTLGIEEGGLHSAESLLLARYFMFSQVYFHRVRRAYDVHLKDFLRAWLPGGSYRVDLASHLEMTDVQVTEGIIAAASDQTSPAHDVARRFSDREHFRVLWSRNPDDLTRNPESGRLVFEAARERFGEDAVRRDRRSPGSVAVDFPVLMKDGRIASARTVSSVIGSIPDAAFDYVFIDRGREDEAKRWFREERTSILPEQGGDESDG